jgi:hypothetical protein
MNYLLYYTHYLNICQTTCVLLLYTKAKNEFGQNPEENIILTGPVNILFFIDRLTSKDK